MLLRLTRDLRRLQAATGMLRAVAGPEVSPEMSPEVLRTQPDRRTRLTPQARQALRRLARPAARSGELSPSAYNLTISHAHRFVWFRVAKVATRTLLGYFEDHGIGLDVNHAYDMRYPTALFGDYFKFGFVRHPLPRFVSTWQDKVVNANYFDLDDTLLARVRERPEAFAAWVADQQMTDADFEAVCRRLDLPVVPAAPRHRTATSQTASLLDSRDLQSAVAELYRLDYQVFGYDPSGS